MLRFVIGIILVKKMFLIETVVKYMVLIFFLKKLQIVSEILDAQKIHGLHNCILSFFIYFSLSCLDARSDQHLLGGRGS